MASSFKGKTALVTGAGRGIGRGIAERLHELGANVIAVSKSRVNLESLQAKYPGIKIIVVDLGDWNATREALEQLEVVDCLVNNAAMYAPGYFLEAKEEDIDTTYNVNLKSIVNVSQIIAKKLIAADRPGAIVNISSTAGIKPMPAGCIYSTFKGALNHLTKNMAVELAPHRIRVNAVNPGMTRTDMLQVAIDAAGDSFVEMGKAIPAVQKIIDISEVANAVTFLLSDDNPMIIGTILAVDGGLCST